MTWSNPAYLLGLWLVAAMAAMYVWSTGKTLYSMKTIVSEHMAQSLLPQFGRTRTTLKGLTLVVALALFCAALAGPMFGFRVEKVARRGTDLFVLLDTSRSMLAEDVAPNRLAAAKLDIEDLLSRSVGDRVGLIAFAGKPVTRVPLTTDLAFYREVLHEIDTHTAPRGGTAIGDAIRLATRLLPRDSSRDKAIVLITDGEDHESMPVEAAQDAAADGVRIYTVALGDFEEGARVPLFDDKGKRTGYEKYQGREIWSKADKNLLEKIATITGGDFIPAGTATYDLGAIYASHLDNLKRSNSDDGERLVPQLQYQWFLFAGIVFFLIYLAISPYSKKTPIAQAANAVFDRSVSTRTPDKTARTIPVLVLAALLAGSQLFAQEETKTTDKAASPDSPVELTDAEKTASEIVNETPVQKYNRACKLIDQGDFSEAKSLLQDLLPDRAKRISAKSQLNLGLILAKEVMEKKIEDEPSEADSSDPTSQNPTVPNALPDAATTSRDSTGSVSGTKSKSPLEQYTEDYKKRTSRREELLSQSRYAADLFAQAAKYPETSESARRNLDVLKSWERQQIAKWDQVELELRERTLSFPEMLQWLETNGRQTDDAIGFDSGHVDAETFQQWFESGENLRTLRGDFDAAARKYSELKEQNRTDKKNAADANDPVDSVLNGAKELFGSAAERLTQFDRKGAMDSLRKSIDQINTVSSLFLPYPALVQGAVAFQESRVDETKKFAQSAMESKVARKSTAAKFTWNSGFVNRMVSLMMDQARQEFAKNPKQQAEEKSKDEKGKSTPEPSADKKKENDSTDKSIPEKAEKSGATEPHAEAQKSPQEKIRQSMELALKLGPEVLKKIETLRKELDSDEDKKAIMSQEEILKLLKEIAKPLQDPNQQNQNQNQNENQNQNQDENKDQNQDEKKDQNQNKDQDQKKDQPNPSKDDKQDQKNSNDKKRTESEKEKEALLRQIRQRLRDAQDAREMLERFQRRTDKPEKDW